MRLTDNSFILIVNLARRYGGATTRVIQIARALHNKFPYAVAVLRGSDVHRCMVDNNLNHFSLPYRRSDPRIMTSLLRIIREFHCTVIDAHNTQSQLWGLLAARIAHIPKRIATVHSTYRTENKGLKGAAHEQVLKLSAWLGCDFITVSEAVYDYVKQLGITTRRISLIHNALDISEYTRVLPNFSIRDSLGWSRKDFVVICVGRLVPVKGHIYLLKALSQAIRDDDHIRCLIVGDGPERSNLELQTRKLMIENHTHFTGFRNDVKELLGASELFCMSSLSEGLPFALLEACASRLPIVASHVGGIGAFLTHNKNAYLVPPENPSAIAAALVELAANHNKAASLSDAAYKLICNKYSLEQMIGNTLSVYTLDREMTFQERH